MVGSRTLWHPPVQKICTYCGHEYSIKQSHAATSKYCSYQCKWAHQKGRPRIDLEERFWAKVDKSGDCWLWTGTISHGYGHFRVGGLCGTTVAAPRLAWELVNGPIPSGLHVCHSCDVKWPRGDISYRRCVNPAHLFLGTIADNSRDMANKGRGSLGMGRRGEANGRAKLTRTDVTTIRERFAEGGLTKAALAREYGVTETTISGIINHKLWRIIN